MAPCAQRPASAICGAAGWGFSAADALAALEEGVANTWGSCDRSTRLILANSVPHVEVNPRRPSRLLFGRSGGWTYLQSKSNFLSIISAANFLPALTLGMV
jgi:hypothetical protein